MPRLTNPDRLVSGSIGAGATPNQSILHLANSMPVRYANLCGLTEQQEISVSANRG
ncbi:hypothetical protein [Spirosoma telluris]|uniref:hypothetical protein n=1 Tax=Spirosoma telluris TaxID=2183553 RepID=UPI002FC278D3